MDDDQSGLPFHTEGVDDMTMIEYLQQAREENSEWTEEFRARYNIPAQTTDDHATAEEMYEAHQHHAEFSPASH